MVVGQTSVVRAWKGRIKKTPPPFCRWSVCVV